MTTTTATNHLHERGKKAASGFLHRQGYTIVEQDWESKAGSVDIIATNEDTLVFVDVKTRLNKDKGLPKEVASKETRSRWEKIAIDYLAQNEVSNVEVRFDTVSLLVVGQDRAFLRHHINALT